MIANLKFKRKKKITAGTHVNFLKWNCSLETLTSNETTGFQSYWDANETGDLRHPESYFIITTLLEIPYAFHTISMTSGQQHWTNSLG